MAKGNVTRLSQARTDALAHKARSGDTRTRNRLLEVLDPIAGAHAWKYLGFGESRGLEKQDLVQEARLAIVKALDTWKPEKARFNTYAYYRAERAILDAINSAHVVTIPRQTAEYTSTGSRCLDTRIKEPYTINAAQQAVKPPLSISQNPLEEDEQAVNPGHFDRDYIDVENRLTVEQIQKKAKLKEHWAEALDVRLKISTDMTQSAYGEEIGLSLERVRQRALQGLRDLRRAAWVEEKAS